jgi:RAB protein geranylgeranyltransferase component A
LGVSAFASYAGATLVIPKQIAEINKNAFYQCTAKVTFEEGSELTVIKEQAFSNFYGEVIFCDGITRIEKNAFFCASSSAVVTFSQTRASITFNEKEAFYGSKAKVTYTD